MKIAAIAPLLLSATVTATNPFAPKTTGNAKSNYVNKLMRGAKATENSQMRRLEEEEYIPDVSQYSVKFQQCQFIKSYNDEMAANEEAGTPLMTERFVIFRLCPSSSCGSCNYGYGEYLVSLETYLEAAVNYQQELQEEMCQTCEEYCEADEEDQNQEERKLKKFARKLEMDCDSCVDECEKIENMEDNGYIEATQFLECQMVYDPEDDGVAGLWAGPICSSGGSKIKIGVFEDEECNVVDSSKNVDDYLVDGDGVKMQLSHALLKKTYDADTCISCEVVEEDDENNDGDNEQDEEEKEPEVTEMCEALYEEAAKCEKTHGFDNGYADYNGYENQLQQEEIVCDFIGSIQKGTYDEVGEIKVSGKSSLGGGAATTGGQKFALTFFIFGTIGLAAYAATLHSKLTTGGKADLASTGGNMA